MTFEPEPQPAQAQPHRVDGGVFMSFECPRCHREITGENRERVYGPCASCRDELRAKYASEPTETFETDRFEPKMNVVPNQVATKE